MLKYSYCNLLVVCKFTYVYIQNYLKSNDMKVINIVYIGYWHTFKARSRYVISI